MGLRKIVVLNASRHVSLFRALFSSSLHPGALPRAGVLTPPRGFIAQARNMIRFFRNRQAEYVTEMTNRTAKYKAESHK